MGEFENLHQILLSLYEEMMPLCSDMAGVAKGLAGLGALFYVAMRVWQSLARAEAIDVYPLLRPFAIGLCILFFPTVVLGTMNSELAILERITPIALPIYVRMRAARMAAAIRQEETEAALRRATKMPS
jgi:conjugative transposon TraJ protein